MRLIIVIAFILFFLSCSKEQYDQQIFRPSGCDSTAFTFEKDVRKIFTSNCNFSDCHAPGGRGSYDFTSYFVVADRVRAGLIDYRLDLPYGDPQHMPDHMQLSACDYFIIKTWIKQGYPQN